MSSLSIFAGPRALSRIRDEGLHASQFGTLVGASGGPKWFVLHELDRYLFGEFFAGRSEPLITLGSSAGAWRLACLATSDPVGAAERLAALYSAEVYSAAPTVEEITSKAATMLAAVLGEHGAQEIAANEVFRTHIVAARCKGLAASRRGYVQGALMGLSAASNAVTRKALSLFYERIIFSNMGRQSPFTHLKDLDTQVAPLTAQNVFAAMMASSAIPFVLEGVRDIPGLPEGLYLDGGIIDYHFDMPFDESDKLVLYPHFSPFLIPGWFDKHVPWHRVAESHLDNVVLLTPSPAFVVSLPFGKITERADFERLDTQVRLDYWQDVLKRSEELAAEFDNLVTTGAGIDRIRPIAERER